MGEIASADGLFRIGMPQAWIGATLLGTFLISAWLTRSFLASRSFFHVLDHPNERSLHRSPVPRTGGVAILGALIAGGAASAASSGGSLELAWVALGALALGLLSFLEDRYGIPRRYRMLAHVLGGVLLVLAGLGLDRLDLPGASWVLPSALVWPFTLLFVAWMINLYNFMDGMDGFAGGMALIGFAALGVVGWLQQDPVFAWTAWLIAAAAGGFLVWNFPPARIFMGDTGSSVLGFLMAAMSLWGVGRGLFPLWVAVLIFSPFIVDATWTLLRRLLRGERVWLPHRGHHYQRLVQAGWGHRKTVLWSYLLMLTCAATAARGVRMSVADQWFLIGAWTGIYALIGWRVGLIERQAGAR